jgi:hypothetical protein
MRIPEANRNMLLLAAVTLCCIVVAGTAALLDPTPVRDKQATDIRQVRVDDVSAVRVVGAPFVPNVNPRER